MRKINRKFIITFLGVLLLSIICFSGITMMFADERNGAGDFATSTDASFGNSVQSNISGAATPTTTPSSIIDWIIDFSNSTDAAIDKEYHIVEIYSGSNPSALSTMVDSDGKFEKLVLDGHKSEGFTPDFKPGNIDYHSFSNKVAAGSTAETNLINAIEKADLVYLSEDPDELWDTDNDITEQLIQTLTKFAVTDGKPFIVDSHNLTMQIKLQSKRLIKDLVGNYYVKEGSSYNTFAFDQTKDIEAVMNTANVTANYKALDGDIPQQSTDPNFGWNKVTYTEVKAEDDPDTDDVNEADSEDHTDYIARVLTIYNSSETTNLTITNKILNCCSGDYSFTFTDNDTSVTQPKNKTVAAKGTFTPDGTVKVLDEESDFYKYAYYGRNARPQALKFETMDLSNATDLTALETIDFTQYDFVIFEEETKDVDISGKDDLFNSLVGAMTNGVHVLYDSKIAPTGSSHGTISELDADGIKQLYNKVATTNDQPKYDSVLVTARQKMNEVYATSTTAEGVKDIANIINAGAFRSIGHGSTDSSNKYTVLEIEPCYPIDTVLAQHLKNARNWNNAYGITFLKASARTNAYSQYSDSFYYLRTDGVSSKTPDEISYGTSASLTSLLENTADLDALITQDNIANVTDYYKWHISKAKIAHATGKSMDEINVVHMSSSEFAASRKTLLDNYDAIYIGGDNSAIKPGDNWYTKGKGNYYNMYFHNGDLYNYSNDQNNKWGGQYGVIGGNDLTYDKMEELKAYAKKMPVILDRTVCDAYVNASLQDNKQHVMDPDSNMYNFIYSVTEIKDSALESKYTSTVLINFDSDYTYKAVNNSDKYGTTYGGYATVFLGNNAPTDAFRTATVNNN
ncbi:MAG TPA: hypothetical protein DEO83_07530, partial [Lachnospiraceae bacterium]|nr:hypothetical protein [Lachnospiraceae bacterium]